MRFVWLWLEDEEETVADLREVVGSKVTVEDFERVTDITRWLLEHRQELKEGKVRIGFILDVMIQGAHAVTRPAGWFNGTEEQVLFTQNGYEAGLVFYENLILGTEGKENSWLLAPPPVIFLTVMHTDQEGLSSRLEKVRADWLAADPSDLKQARVAWMRKWDVEADDFVSLLRGWQEAK